MVKDPEQNEESGVPHDEIWKIVKEGEAALADRSRWEDKQTTWYTKRHGLRSQKSFPWKGASNLNIPFTDKVIRRLKPTFQSAIFGVNPVASFEPLGNTSPRAARSMENAYDWLLRHRMDRSREEANFTADAMLTYGFAVKKVVWEYEADRFVRKLMIDFVPEGTNRSEFGTADDVGLQLSRRLSLDPQIPEERRLLEDAVKQFFSGADPVQVEVVREIYNAPRWHYVDPVDCIVPWDATTDVDSLPWIQHRMYLTDHELAVRSKSGRYGKAEVELAREGRNEDSSHMPNTELETRKQLNEGISGNGRRTDNRHEVWEVYFRYDLDGDGVCERFVATVHRGSRQILRVIPYPYEHGEWPFTRFAFEQTEPRWYSSRGIPALLYDLQTEINAQHNAKIDNMSITNSKSFIYKEGSVSNPGNWRFRPGAMFPTKRGPSDVQVIAHQSMDFSFNAEEENLRQWGEEYVGTPDFGISNINQRVERRTATEIDQIQQSTGAVAAETLARYQESMRRVHRQTLFLWRQFGDDSVDIRINGSDETSSFSRFDLYKDFDLVPTGKLDNLSATQRAQKANQIAGLAGNPFLQAQFNPQEIAREIVENLDFRNSNRYLVDPGNAENAGNLAQSNEISWMRNYGQVSPVDQFDEHQSHAEAVQQALQAVDDEGLSVLMQAHLAMHMFFLGDKSLLEQMAQAGFQVQQTGTKLMMAVPQQAPQQAEGGGPSEAQ